MSYFNNNNRFSNTGGMRRPGIRTVEDMMREILGMDYDPDIARNRVPVSFFPEGTSEESDDYTRPVPRFNSIREAADFFRKQALEEDAANAQSGFRAPVAARSPFGSIRELAQAFRDGWRPEEPDAQQEDRQPPMSMRGGIEVFNPMGPFLDNLLGASKEASAKPDKKAPAPLSAEQGLSIVAKAATWEGAPYEYGGSTRQGIDCSHLVHEAYSEAGFTYSYIPTSGDWKSQGFIEVSVPQPGDVILWAHHCGIVVDPASSKFIHAPRKNKPVQYSNYNSPYWKNISHVFLRYCAKGR